MKYKGNLPIDFFNSGVKTALMLSCSREETGFTQTQTHPPTLQVQVCIQVTWRAWRACHAWLEAEGSRRVSGVAGGH